MQSKSSNTRQLTACVTDAQSPALLQNEKTEFETSKRFPSARIAAAPAEAEQYEILEQNQVLVIPDTDAPPTEPAPQPKTELDETPRTPQPCAKDAPITAEQRRTLRNERLRSD
jgi:hypothetical protein